MRARLLVNKLNEVGLSTSARVGLGLPAALGEEFDGGVASDALVLGRSLRIFTFGVDLGDEYPWFVGKVLGYLLPYRGETLAV